MSFTNLFNFLDRWEDPAAETWQKCLRMLLWAVVLMAFAAEMLILCYIFG